MLPEATLRNESLELADFSFEENNIPSSSLDIDVKIYGIQKKILLHLQISPDNKEIKISGNNIKILKDRSCDQYTLEVELSEKENHLAPQQSCLNTVVFLINSLINLIDEVEDFEGYSTIVVEPFSKLSTRNVDLASKRHVLENFEVLITEISKEFVYCLVEDICTNMQFGSDLERETSMLITVLSANMHGNNTTDKMRVRNITKHQSALADAWTSFYDRMLLTAYPDYSNEQRGVAILDFYHRVLNNLDQISKNNYRYGPYFYFKNAFDSVEEFMNLTNELKQPLLDEITERVRGNQDNIYVRSGFVGLIIEYSDNDDITRELINATLETLRILKQDSEFNQTEAIQSETDIKYFFEQVKEHQEALFEENIVKFGKK